MSSTNVQQTHRFDLFADYHQLYLEDRQAQRDDETVEALDARIAQLLSAPAHARHLGVAPGIICLHTARNLTVPLEVELRDQAPTNDLAGWDRVVEASLSLPSGVLVLHGPTDYLPDAPHLPLPPGTYRVRAYFGGLDTLSPDGLEGADHYKVALWPGEEQEPTVLLPPDQTA